MKIRMIGTGSMISSDNPASYLIDNKIMIDMPNGIVKALKKQSLFENVEYVFITHLHGDHIFDLPFLFLDRLKTNKSLFVVLDKRWFKTIKKLVKLAFPRQYYNIFYCSNIKFVFTNINIVDNLKITRIEVEHGNMKPSYGYSIIEKDTKVFITGDSCLNDTLLQTIEKHNLLICDCTNAIGNNKHMGVDNIEFLLTCFPKLKIIPSHMGITAKEKLKKITNKNLIIKEDMEEFDYE